MDDDPDAEFRFAVAANTEGITLTLKFASLLLHKILAAADERLGLGLKERIKKLLGEIDGMRTEFPQS